MFGYVTPLKQELKIKDFNRFRSYYCGLCFNIKEDFGNIPRMALNYDMTFLALLLDGLSIDEVDFEFKRCATHPVKKKPTVIKNKALSYAAAINVALVYYKILDDVEDDKTLSSKLKLFTLSPYKNKFNNATKDLNEIISTKLKILSDLEDNLNFSCIDEICHPFSEIVGEILKCYPNELVEDGEELRDNLYNLGYTLGKWIYLIDALDDLKKDMENKEFNPIIFLYNKSNLSYEALKENIKEKIEFTILNCSYNCALYLSKLPLQRNIDILKNTLELGMMDKYMNVLNNTNENKRRGFK
ncbi:MAG: DUF5685 family protein [Clostridium sp.]